MSLNRNITKCFDIKYDMNKKFYLQSYVNNENGIVLYKTNLYSLISICLALRNAIRNAYVLK